MRAGTIDAVIVGADRITFDAVFNKIGTYMHAVCARHHNIPFYVAAPLSTFDTKYKEKEVIIEERGREEVTTIGDRVFVPDAAHVKNYAFDATPDGPGYCHNHRTGCDTLPCLAPGSILSLKNTQ